MNATFGHYRPEKLLEFCFATRRRAKVARTCVWDTRASFPRGDAGNSLAPSGLGHFLPTPDFHVRAPSSRRSASQNDLNSSDNLNSTASLLRETAYKSAAREMTNGSRVPARRMVERIATGGDALPGGVDDSSWQCHAADSEGRPVVIFVSGIRPRKSEAVRHLRQRRAAHLAHARRDELS